MNYAIIGTGRAGAALARRFAGAGIHVTLANRHGPETIAPLADELGETVTAKPVAEALDADVVLLALPFAEVEGLGRQRADWSGKIVVDATNAYGVTPEFLAGRLSSEIVAAAMPGAAVVKAFNQLPAGVLAREPAQDGGRRIVFVASNDRDAGSAVTSLAERLGFAPIMLGRIDEGGRLLHIPGPLTLHNLVEHPLK